MLRFMPRYARAFVFFGGLCNAALLVLLAPLAMGGPASTSVAAPAPVTAGAAIAKILETDDAPELKALLDRGLESDALVKGTEGMVTYTLLEYACRMGKPAVVKLLVERGAPLLTPTVCGRLPVEIVLEERRPDLAKLLEIRGEEQADEVLFDRLAYQLIRSSTYFRDGGIKGVFVNHALPSEKLALLLKETGFLLDAKGQWLEIEFKILDPFEKDRVHFKFESGEALAGGITTGVFELKFGYWLRTTTESMDK